MDLSLKLQVELLEILQAIHQQIDQLRVYLLPPKIDDLERHILNLTRLKIQANLEDADLIIGSCRAQLKIQDLKVNKPLLLTDHQFNEHESLVKLLSKGYRIRFRRYLEPIHIPLNEEHKLRILVITNLYPPQELGGYGRSIFDFVHNLRQLGHHIQVLSSNAPYLGGDISKDKEVDRNLSLLGSYEDGLKAIDDIQERKQRTQKNISIIQKYAIKMKPQAVLLGNLDMLSPEILQTLVNIGLPCWHHHGFSQPAFPPNELPAPGGCYKPVANSHFTARALEKYLPEFGKIPVIYPGAQTNLYSDLNPPPLGGPLKIAFAGLLIGAKGAHILIEALSHLNTVKIPFKCEFAGGHLSEEYPQELMKFINANRLSSQIDFLGQLNRIQLRQLFARNQVFVFPSTWEEPFGISQVEALAAGMLVVSSGTGGAGETVHDDINGRRFRPSDSINLAEVLREIWLNPTKHEHLRERGRQLAQSHFDTGIESRKLSELMIKDVSQTKVNDISFFQ